ncbi:MAG: hypothetical protein AAGG44_14280 [Planctomycetota bacterium]
MTAYFTATLLLSAVGCSVFSASSLTEYEEARKSIETPDGTFRPEGKSAEADYSAAGVLDRFGYSRKRRRDIDVAQSHYRRADEIFAEAKELDGTDRRDRFRAAAEEYKLAAKNWQSSGLEQDALPMAAEAKFFAEDYYQAETLYGDLVKEYPRNPYLDHVDTRRFEIADYWLKYNQAKPSPFFLVNLSDYKRPWNDTGGHGKRVIEAIRLDNPTGKIGDDATMRLAMEHYEADRYEEAADAFADLRMTYPDSEHLFNAQLLEIDSLIQSYQGPAYSSIPVTDAQKRLEQLTRQFPQQSQKQKEQLQKSYAAVRFAMAERIWTQADYRRKQSANGAAKFHYERILEEYSDTPFAEQAREELAKIQDAPDTPPQRFKALVWLLGGTTDEKPWRQRMEAAKSQ